MHVSLDRLINIFHEGLNLIERYYVHNHPKYVHSNLEKLYFVISESIPKTEQDAMYFNIDDVFIFLVSNSAMNPSMKISGLSTSQISSSLFSNCHSSSKIHRERIRICQYFSIQAPIR